MSKKLIEQKQEAGARVAQIKKVIKRIDSNLLDKYKHYDYFTDKSQDSQSNGKANLEEIEDLNIG